jgi:predicted flap endonuclease-1-like 5' DNA nuclease
MKSKKSAPSAPEYGQLLGAFDEAQSAYEQAKVNERAIKQALKTDVKHRSKLEEDILRLTLNQVKHLRKAEKSNVRIAQLMIKLWLKTSVSEAKTQEVVVEVVEMPAKKKRGRQPKAKVDTSEAAAPAPQASATIEAEAPAPKKRGRQPKVKIDAAETAEVVETVETVEVAEVAEVAAPKKNKGKAKVEAIVEVAETVIDIAPKRRGRQPKVAVEAEVEVETEVEEGIAGVSARAMETADAAPAAETREKKPRRSREEIAAQKTAEAEAQQAALKGDDFKIIEGVGPKVTALLHENGIATFQDLANKSYEELKALMMAHRQYLAKPHNWAQQAQLAADGKMEELEALKATLKGGI